MFDMLKKLLFKCFKNKNIARCINPVVLKLHNAFYDLSGILAISINDGVHPKHRILRYKEWFVDHVESNFVVLDVGSNTGAMPSLLAQKAQYVYGIEIDPKHSEVARKRYSNLNLEFLTGDATTYNYENCQPINCITLSNVLEHIEDRVNFLKRLQHGVVWNGATPRLFLIRVPTLERDWLSVYKKELGLEYRLDRTHKIEHTQQQLLEELAAAGLNVVSFETRFGECYVVAVAGNV